MASIVSSLNAENEVRLEAFFSSRVRFHLLYKSSHHGAGVDQLLKRFDTNGKYLLITFLESGSMRGAFMSKSLAHGKSFSDNEAFVFTIWCNLSKRFPQVSYENTVIPVNVDSGSVSFAKGLHLQLDNGSWYVTFSTDVYYGRTKSDNNVCCLDVELHRVQDLNDILPNTWREVVWQEI